ncbi:hypothetical protein BSKO_08555 [Bryopsis sp. KO-2023]|nr:hypothetical protein BSKO_08555 [Bryopsis sp. KO-2023]
MPVGQGGYLSIGCKRTDHTELKDPILRYVRKVYGDQQVEEVSSDLDEVVQLRSEVVALSGDGSSDTARDTLQRYFRALSVMETRFPISRERDHVQVTFVWLDAVQLRKKSKQINIHFEKAAVAFNIAAILSQQGVGKDKNSPEGCKEAAQAFQEAAGAFVRVKDVVLKMENPRPTDLSVEALNFFEKLMLAQAQETAYCKAVKDKKTQMVLARLAKQASILYSEALGFLAGPLGKDYFEKAWPTHVQVKSWILEAEAENHAASTVTDGKDIALEIARLRQAYSLVQKVKKSTKGTGFDTSRIRPLEDIINVRLTNAEKDNQSVYLVKVPTISEVAAIEGYQLVKPLPLDKLDASQEHLFSTLVPESSAKAVSRYSELLDDLVREQMSQLEGATDDARIKLKEWEMPELLDAVHQAPLSMIPEGLSKDLDEIEQMGGVQYLQETSSQVKALRRTTDEILTKIEGELDAEALEDANHREKYGSQWRPQPSSELNGHFRQLIANYRGNLESAGKSDGVVEEKFNENLSALHNLTREIVGSQLPKLEAPIINMGSAEPAVVIANIRKALDQMNAMSVERAALEDALKDKKQKDNLLPKLMSSGASNHEDLFKTSLAAYDGLKEEIKQNLVNHEELLTYMGQAVRTFRETFNVEEWRVKINMYSREVKDKVKVMYEVRDNLGEGIRFYMSLQDAVSTLKQQVSDFAMTRRIQSNDNMERLNRPRGGGPLGAVAGAIGGISRRLFPGQPEQSSQPNTPQQPPPLEQPQHFHPAQPSGLAATPSWEMQQASFRSDEGSQPAPPQSPVPHAPPAAPQPQYAPPPPAAAQHQMPPPPTPYGHQPQPQPQPPAPPNPNPSAPQAQHQQPPSFQYQQTWGDHQQHQQPPVPSYYQQPPQQQYQQQPYQHQPGYGHPQQQQQGYPPPQPQQGYPPPLHGYAQQPPPPGLYGNQAPQSQAGLYGNPPASYHPPQ